MSIENKDSIHGKAEIVSKFNFMQEVWFLNGMNICKGKVVGIKGQKEVKWLKYTLMLELETSSDGIHSSSFWINEADIYGSREDLVHRIITL